MEKELLELNLKRKETQRHLADVKHAYTKKRRRQLLLAKQSQPENATLVTKNMCMLLLLLNNYGTVVPRIWLKRKYDDTEMNCSYTDTDWDVLIERWFMETPTIDLERLPDYDSRTGLAQYQRAAQFTAEYKTENWIFACNKNKGVAPTSDKVSSIYELERRRIFLSMLNGLDGPPSDPKLIVKRRSWAHLFRSRWRTKYGSMGVREEYTIEQLRAKA
jgi:hypothetical protein